MTICRLSRRAAGPALLIALLGVAAACGPSGGGGVGSVLDPSALRPPAVHSVIGRVWADADEGETPVAAALVEIHGSAARRTVATDEEGRYQLLGVEASRWTVEVQKEGFAAAAVEIDLDETIELDFRLERTPE